MTASIPAADPLIDIDVDSAEWWRNLQEGRLLCPRCEGCGTTFFPPAPTCLNCGSQKVNKIEVSGRGVVYSWVVVHIPLDPTFADDVPYTIVAVELEEGARMFGRLCGEGEASANAAVRFRPHGVGGRTLPGFELE